MKPFESMSTRKKQRLFTLYIRKKIIDFDNQSLDEGYKSY